MSASVAFLHECDCMRLKVLCCTGVPLSRERHFFANPLLAHTSLMVSDEGTVFRFSTLPYRAGCRKMSVPPVENGYVMHGSGNLRW